MKKYKSQAAASLSAFKADDPWAPAIMIGDNPMKAGDSAIDSIKVGVAFFIAMLFPTDLNHMAEINEYENFTLMMQHSVLAIQHVHSFATKAEAFKEELVHKTKEVAGFLTSLNNVEAKMKLLLDQAKVAKQAQDQTEEKVEAVEAVADVFRAEAKEFEAKISKVEANLATKAPKIKAADEKAYAKGQADMRDAYKEQVNQDCN
ncbi:uncharacterized protein LOC114287992 [Camellia sinensis]|uniref:uncharacterized protein LOC114287992 n=1 Tax=Camellia sinensis TaxID=4442 RepID=UPI001035FD55|nr:uncharacterized protein LOC114287992 [Camellia sinensis]XP_028087292.1 uncharacterized protein LOC114287992 [Camellia sinensis]